MRRDRNLGADVDVDGGREREVIGRERERGDLQEIGDLLRVKDEGKHFLGADHAHREDGSLLLNGDPVEPLVKGPELVVVRRVLRDPPDSFREYQNGFAVVDEVGAVGAVPEDGSGLGGEVSDEGELGHEPLHHRPQDPGGSDVHGEGQGDEGRIDGELARVVAGDDVGFILDVLGTEDADFEIGLVERINGAHRFLAEIEVKSPGIFVIFVALTKLPEDVVDPGLVFGSHELEMGELEHSEIITPGKSFLNPGRKNQTDSITRECGSGK